ncbi:MAG: lytic transglycosylase domain-containing protein [Dissulfurispiraceae bacterium]|jgi:soluble lytic murein transglycosylase|nr:lytic transglycosylase domain-containing protein [Dissulfurispiraceae bacterium]
MITKKLNTKYKIFSKLCSLMLLSLFLVVSVSAQETLSEGLTQLKSGKGLLDRREYSNAVAELSAAIEKVPDIADYGLLWRSMAYEGMYETSLALNDITTILSEHRTSPLIKTARKKEIELNNKLGSIKTTEILEAYVKDYPYDWDMKFLYAGLLKNSGQTEKAAAIYKNLYIQPTPFSGSARKELPASAITTEDMVKRGENLNKAWFFQSAEKIFREASAKNSSNLSLRIKEGLALSVFRQKKYSEAAEIYRQLNNSFWHAKSLLRTGNIEGFEAIIPDLNRFSDKNTASLLVAYASVKRRQGDSEKALSVLNNLLPQFSSSEEQITWTTGWTLMLAGSTDRASEIFSDLYKKYRDPKYLYWSRRTSTSNGAENSSNNSESSVRQGGIMQNFYSYANILMSGKPLAQINKKPLTQDSICCSRRAALLAEAGFKNEAAAELVHYSKKPDAKVSGAEISASLHKLGSHRLAMIFIAKSGYSDDLHELLYPAAYFDEVKEAAKETGVDPLLLLAIMREESRFASDARSIAGALGLLQLMPATAQRVAKSVKVPLTNTNELCSPQTNIRLGAHYIKQLINRLGSVPMAIAAYNAGEHMVLKWIKEGNYNDIDLFIEDIPYRETRNYVKKVLTSYIEYTRSLNPENTEVLRRLFNKI